jgi:dTDP-glucose 4,6-dehydratase
MSNPEKFIVIGSNCFSGACFVDYVLGDNPDSQVIGISRSPEKEDFFLPYKSKGSNRFHFHALNLNNQLDEIVSVIKEFRPDYIVNFSAQGMVAQSWDNPDQWFKTNGIALMSLADRLKQENYLKRFVQISTPEVYGSCSGHIKEDAPLNPSTPYAASKACGDLSLIPYHKNYNFPVVFTRATNVYGAHQQLYRIIPRTVIYIKQNKKVQLQGGGKAVKSYIHIRDVCAATLQIARNGKNGGIYHISPDGEGISIVDLVSLICGIMDRPFNDCVTTVGERLGQDAFYLIDSNKLRKSLGWEPRISLEKGITEVIDWVEGNFDLIQKSSLEYIHQP